MRPIAMTFDQQLGRAFDTISGLIRAEVSRQVHAVSDELAAARLGVVARESEAATARLADGIRAIGSGYACRVLRGSTFGRGFDSRRLHHFP